MSEGLQSVVDPPTIEELTKQGRCHRCGVQHEKYHRRPTYEEITSGAVLKWNIVTNESHEWNWSCATYPDSKLVSILWCPQCSLDTLYRAHKDKSWGNDNGYAKAPKRPAPESKPADYHQTSFQDFMNSLEAGCYTFNWGTSSPWSNKDVKAPHSNYHENIDQRIYKNYEHLFRKFDQQTRKDRS